MKITLCGSMQFANEMLETAKALKDFGHEAIVPLDTHECVEDPSLNGNLEHCIRTNIDKDHFDKISYSDAILVLNHFKNGISGYVGGATLMEIAIARHLNKKIFLLHDLPNEDKLRYVLEIKITQPIILKGDLTKIK